jgi:hypothetical protein
LFSDWKLVAWTVASSVMLSCKYDHLTFSVFF